MELLGCSLLWSSWAGGTEERMWWDPNWSNQVNCLQGRARRVLVGICGPWTICKQAYPIIPSQAGDTLLFLGVRETQDSGVKWIEMIEGRLA